MPYPHLDPTTSVRQGTTNVHGKALSERTAGDARRRPANQLEQTKIRTLLTFFPSRVARLIGSLLVLLFASTSRPPARPAPITAQRPALPAIAPISVPQPHPLQCRLAPAAGCRTFQHSLRATVSRQSKPFSRHCVLRFVGVPAAFG
jgi:hypothetical protein